jgi:hypothetical protein
MKRNPKIKKAGAVTPAKNQQQGISYPKAVPLSSLIQIGSLLLLLAGSEQPDGWQRFDQLLHQFYEGVIV